MNSRESDKRFQIAERGVNSTLTINKSHKLDIVAPRDKTIKVELYVDFLPSKLKMKLIEFAGEVSLKTLCAI